MRRKLSLLATTLLLGGCGVKTLPQNPEWDAPKVRGSLTGNETIFDSANNVEQTPAPKAKEKAWKRPANYRDIHPKEVPYTPPLLSSRADTLPCGAVVYWVEDSSLPIANVRIIWKEGSLGVSPQEAVDLDFLGTMLSEGGAGRLTPRQVSDTLEELGAEASIDFGTLRTEVELSGFSRDLPFLFDLMDSMIIAPRFDTARLSVIRTEAKQDIAHRLDAPAQVLGAAWNQVQYGPSAWTRSTDTAEVMAVTTARMKAALRGRLRTKALVSVAGRCDRAAMRERLERFFRSRLEGGTPADSLRLHAHPALPVEHEAGVWLAPVEATQAFIRIGTRFVQRDDSDYYPLMLACQVLGSGFGTRLVDRVRSDEGLAYHVAAFAGSDYDRQATLGVELQTKSASAQKAVQIVFEEINRLRDGGFRPGELEKARRGLKAALPTYFDSPEATADMFLVSAAWGRQDDHFRNFQKALDTIPDSTVLAAFRRWFVPGNLRIVVAGPKTEMQGTPADGSFPFSHWGTVHELGAEDLFRDDRN